VLPLVIARREARLLVQDPMPLILLLVVPLVMLAFLKPVLFIALVIGGRPRDERCRAGRARSGGHLLPAAHRPGRAQLFREHGWGTWDRLRASPASSAQIVAGKLLPLYAFALAQAAWIFGVGVALFGLPVRGSPVALALLAAAATATHLALGLLVVAAARTIQQVNALANLGAALLAGLGGALVPSYLLPGWARAVSPFTPTHWLMEGYRAVTLDGRGLDGVALPALVLPGFAAAFAAAALARFSVEEARGYWA
jgi:ABC-2 type transport system permease protein